MLALALFAFGNAMAADDVRPSGGITGYYYAWSELGWTPVEWLRVGLVGQCTNTVDTGRELQRGVFAQATVERLTFGVYFFNPDSGARYAIASVGASF